MVALAGDRMVWRIQFNQETCSICEICVKHCPTQALTLARGEAMVEIRFDSGACDGCNGGFYCKRDCPEDAVIVSRVPADTLPPQPELLIRGQLARCQGCGTTFMPERKLETLLKQRKITQKSVQLYCPACRRERLMDRYLDGK